MWGLNDYLSIGVHGGADSGGGIAGGVSGLLTFLESLVRQSPAETFVSVLPGISALQNVHPLFVHFPIALISLFFLIDVVGSLAQRAEWRQIAGWFLYLGTGFAAVTVAAGLVAAASVAHGGNVHEIMENHEHLAISVLSLSVVLSAWRLLAKGLIVGPANTLYLLLATILCGLLVFTADLGGLMVYKYGVSVAAADQLNQAAAQAHSHSGAAEPATEFLAPIDHEELEDAGSDHHDAEHDSVKHEHADDHHNHQHAH